MGWGAGTPCSPLVETGAVTVKLVVAERATVDSAAWPTGTEPSCTGAACTGAPAKAPKAMRSPLRLPTYTTPSYAVGVANFEAVPMPADQSSGRLPSLGVPE